MIIDYPTRPLEEVEQAKRLTRALAESDLTEDAARNELAAVRLFLRIPDGQSVISYLRKDWLA